MKNPMEVLKMKEEEVVKVRSEIDALRTVARLLDDNAPNGEQKQDLRQLIELP